MNRLEYKYTLPKRIEDNIMLCFFKLAVQAGLTVFNLIDGLVDEFEDQSGVDTGASTSESYDATNDLYSPNFPGESIYAQVIVNNDADYLGNVADIQCRPRQSFLLAAEKVITQLKITFNANSGSPVGQVICRIETDNGSDQASGVLAHANATSTFTPTPSAENIINFTDFILPAGTYWIVLNCDDQALDVKWRVALEAAGTSYSDGHAAKTVDGVWQSKLWDCNFKIYAYTPTNMTLISNAVTAEAAPVKSRIVIFEEDVDAGIVNTDIKAYVSRDGGTTWTQHTLSDEGDYETGKRILSSDAVAISAQPAGTTMKWKVETLNNKNLKIHAVGVNWD